MHEEGQRTPWQKPYKYNNKNEDNSLKTLNDENSNLCTAAWIGVFHNSKLLGLSSIVLWFLLTKYIASFRNRCMFSCDDFFAWYKWSFGADIRMLVFIIYKRLNELLKIIYPRKYVGNLLHKRIQDSNLESDLICQQNSLRRSANAKVFSECKAFICFPVCLHPLAKHAGRFFSLRRQKWFLIHVILSPPIKFFQRKNNFMSISYVLILQNLIKKIKTYLADIFIRNDIKTVLLTCSTLRSQLGSRQIFSGKMNI